MATIAYDDSYSDFLGGAFRIPHGYTPRHLLVLTAYVDESGQSDQDKWMFVAGFVGNKEQWEEVERGWAAAIAPRRSLHMKKLRFARESERQMLIRVAEVIRSSGVHPILGGVRQADYLPTFKGSEEERLLNGYVACCFAFAVNTIRIFPQMSA